MGDIPQHQIRAAFNEHTIRVYQAFRDDIADTALTNGTFVSPPFSMSRMTWVKPSFLWMMYRAGWGYKDPGQKRILAIDMTRTGFEWALAHACSSHRHPTMSNEEWVQFKNRHPVRIQWDPERDLLLRPLPYRSLQMGLSGLAAEFYVEQWIVKIEEVTQLGHQIHALIQAGRLSEAEELIPQERIYPLGTLLDA
jgi:hypothetical protein